MQSFMSSILAAGFKIKGKSTEAEIRADLEKRLQQGETPTPPPENPKTRFEENPNGGGIFYANENTSSRFTVFYLHGGAYLHDFHPFHWRFLDTLIGETDAMVVAPAYRLVPFGTWKDAFDLIIPVYKSYVEQHPEKKIILMGDSAGGGLSLALAEQFKLDGIRMPDELILLSPWVDVTMENPATKVYVDEDPWLAVFALSACAQSWAADNDPHDYQISPINGDLQGIGNVTVFTGTREALLPDTLKLYERLGRDETNELIVGRDMLHVYPLMPTPEAKQARDVIFAKITR